MPLPFLKPKHVAGLIISQRKPDGSREEKSSEANENEGLEACMEDFIRAHNAKDPQGMAQAFKAAFEVCESYPHEEDNSFEAQNIKAAQERNE